MIANRILSLTAAGLSAAVCLAQTTAPIASPPANSSSNEAKMAELVNLRNDFIQTVRARGFEPTLAPPIILLDNPPSYGNYEDEKNILHIAAWSALSPDQQARFWT